MKQTGTDILIIGSGPVGAAYARTIHDALPGLRMMIDLGPKVSDTIGEHVLLVKHLHNGITVAFCSKPF